MNVTCNRSALFEAVQLASSIVPTRSPKPVLQCTRIGVDQTKKLLTVIASDDEITIECKIAQVEIAQEGVTVLPADRVTGILRESNDESIRLEASESACEIIGMDSRFKVLGQRPDDFPVFEFKKARDGFKVKAQQLKAMIHQVSFAASRESSRYALNGVLWEKKGKQLRMVATDGRRLAQVDGEVESGGDDERTAIVPIKVMTLLERIVSDPDEVFEISFSSNQAMIFTSNVSLMSTLVQGRFPKYEDVIPTDCDKKIPLNVDAFQSAVRRAALLTNEQSRGVAFQFSQGKLRFSSSTPEMGEAEINLPVQYDREESQIGFNPQYLLEMLRVVESEEVDFEFRDGKRPGLLRDGKRFLYVVMPVTV